MQGQEGSCPRWVLSLRIFELEMDKSGDDKSIAHTCKLPWQTSLINSSTPHSAEIKKLLLQNQTGWLQIQDRSRILGDLLIQLPLTEGCKRVAYRNAGLLISYLKEVQSWIVAI